MWKDFMAALLSNPLAKVLGPKLDYGPSVTELFPFCKSCVTGAFMNRAHRVSEQRMLPSIAARFHYGRRSR
jgi:hypothetical protein